MNAHADAIVDLIVSRLGLEPGGGSWQIEFEWVDPLNHLNLNERRRTQVDVVLRNQKYLIFAECKFTETDGGACSRPLPKQEFDGLSECNGDYDWQEDPIRYALFSHFGVSIKDAKCALSRAGIRYWDFIAEVLHIDPTRIFRPCPLNASLYQWARNLILCWRVATSSGLIPIVLIVFAHQPGLPMSDRIGSRAWKALVRSVRQDRILFRTVSYQKIIDVALELSIEKGWQDDSWTALHRWVDRKIATSQRLLRKRF